MTDLHTPSAAARRPQPRTSRSAPFSVGTEEISTRLVSSIAPGLNVASVARGGLTNLVGAAFAGLSGFIVTWFVARALGSVQAGAFFASTAAFVLIGTVAKLGTQTSLVYWPARLRAFGNVVALRACLRTGLAPVAITSLLIAAAMWLGADALARIAVHDGRAAYAHQLRLLAFFLPVAALSDALLAATRGWRALKPTVMLDRLLRPGLQVGLLAGLIALGVASPAAFVLAWAAPYVPSAVLAARALHRLLRATEANGLPVPVATARHAAEPIEANAPWVAADFWRFSAPRAVASILQLALQRVDVLLLASIAGLRAAAVYAVAGRFVVLGQFANQGISQAVQPRLAELLATGDRVGANALYQTATTWLILAAWPLYLLVAVFADSYLGVFGNGYHAGAPVVVVLAAAMTVATGCGMVDMVLAMAGRTWWNLANVMAALIVQLVIDVALIPRLGPLGAAIGLGVAITVNNLLPLIQIGLMLGIHPFGSSTLASALLTVGCFGVIPVVVAGALGTGLVAAFLAVGLGGLFYAVGLIRLRGVLRLAAFVAIRRTRSV